MRDKKKKTVIETVLQDIKRNGIPVMEYTGSTCSGVSQFRKRYVRDVDKEIVDAYIDMMRAEMLGNRRYDNHKSLSFERVKSKKQSEESEDGWYDIWDHVSIGQQETRVYTTQYADLCQHIVGAMCDLKTINPRQYRLLVDIYYLQCTQRDIAIECGVTPQAVSQMHDRAIKRLKRMVVQRLQQR